MPKWSDLCRLFVDATNSEEEPFKLAQIKLNLILFDIFICRAQNHLTPSLLIGKILYSFSRVFALFQIYLCIPSWIIKDSTSCMGCRFRHRAVCRYIQQIRDGDDAERQLCVASCWCKLCLHYRKRCCQRFSFHRTRAKWLVNCIYNNSHVGGVWSV